MMLAAALLLEWCLGDPRTQWHPVALFGAFADRIERGVYADHHVAGAVAWSFAVIGPLILLSWLLWQARLMGDTYETALGAVAIWSSLGWRSLLSHVEAVGAAAETSEARESVAMIVGRDVEALELPEIRRAALESLAENASDAVVAPLFWSAIAGPLAAVAYRMINTLDAMWGHRSPRYARFGWFAARLDDLANWLPARITAGLYLLFACRRVSSVLIGQARAHPSTNAGWPEAALAHALRIRLGGPARRSGREERRPWMGPSGAMDPDTRSFGEGLKLTQRVLVASAACGGLVWL